jgi:hypothetical protein
MAALSDITARSNPIIARVYSTPATNNARTSAPAVPTQLITPTSSPAPAKAWPPNINTDYEALWPVIALRHTPPGPSGDCVAPRGTPWSGAWVKQLCVARNVYYAGTCSPESTQSVLNSAGITTKVVSTAGQAGVTVGSMVAAGATAIPIIGLAVGAISSIIGAIVAHHAQAVVNEQQAECSVVAICQGAIPTIDQAVYSGQITAQQGIAAHQQVVTQCKAILAPVTGAGSGGHPCNAGCCFGYWLDCLQDFATTYYVDLAPPAVAPVSAPQAAPTVTGNATQAPQGGTVVQTNLSGTLSSQQAARAVAPSPLTNSPVAPSSAYQASVQTALVQDAVPPGGSPIVSSGSPSTGYIFLALLVVLGVFLFAKVIK